MLSDAKIGKNGDLYVAGTIQNSLLLDSTLTYNPVTLTSTGPTDILILKFDTTGHLSWFRQIGRQAAEWPATLVLDSDDNAYVMGGFSDTLDVDPGPAIFNLYGHSYLMADIFILKLNASGNFIWGKSLGDIRPDFVHNAAIDQNNDIYLTGTFQDSLIINTINGADTIYTKPYDALNNKHFSSIFLIKMDSAGNNLWSRQTYNTSSPNPKITLDEFKSIYVADTFTDSLIFGHPNNYSYLYAQQAQAKNGYIAKWDSSGNFNWAKRLGSSNECNIKSVKTDHNNEVLVVGNYIDTLYFNPNNLSDHYISYNHTKDLFMEKMDNSGAEIYTAIIGGKGIQTANDICIDQNNYIYLTGSFQDTVDTDFNIGIANLSCNINEPSIFVSKYAPTPLSIPQYSSADSILVFPNPSNGLFTIKNQENATIVVTNMQGQIILRKQITKTANQIDISQYNMGIYLLNIFNDKIHIFEKITKW